MSEREALARATAMLAEAGIDGAAGEARKLWRAFPDAARFMDLAARRAAGEPMSHLLGYRDFWKHRFEVSGAVLDPRPDTEALVAAVLEVAWGRVLDLGTGSGCILLSLLAERAGATGVGTDLSEDALAVAGRNVAKLELDHRVSLIRSDWFGAVQGTYDLIVSNPPYIAAAEMDGLQPELSFEPRMALTDEGDGLSAYRAICAGAGAHLAPGGWLMVEIGWQQGEPVSELFRAAGLEDVRILPDLDGRDRVIVGRKPL